MYAAVARLRALRHHYQRILGFGGKYYFAKQWILEAVEIAVQTNNIINIAPETDRYKFV